MSPTPRSTDEAPPKIPTPVRATSATRVNVAFPFSQIKVTDPRPELAELAELAADLTKLVQRLTPSPEADALVDRSDDLLARLR